MNGEPIDEGQGETVPFALDGVDYEIDLNEENAAKLSTGRPVSAAARQRHDDQNPGHSMH
jgi:hypothetical protein